jgi:hypothetical protein
MYSNGLVRDERELGGEVARKGSKGRVSRAVSCPDADGT